MARIISRSMVTKFLRWLIVWSAILGVMAPALAFAQDLTFSATVDKTTVTLSEPVTLTLTLTGDLGGVDLSELQLPEGFVIAARSQSTNFSISAGATERSMNLIYVLVPQQAGTFQLGPFAIRQHKKEFHTEAIEITVKQSSLPPPSRLRPQGERYTL